MYCKRCGRAHRGSSMRFSGCSATSLPRARPRLRQGNQDPMRLVHPLAVISLTASPQMTMLSVDFLTALSLAELRMKEDWRSHSLFFELCGRLHTWFYSDHIYHKIFPALFRRLAVQVGLVHLPSAFSTDIYNTYRNSLSRWLNRLHVRHCAVCSAPTGGASSARRSRTRSSPTLPKGPAHDCGSSTSICACL